MVSVVVICLDSVRKDYFDRYANKIQRMSDFSMSECRSGSSWSVPSHASFLTGRLPSEHGIHTDNIDFSTVDKREVLTGALDKHHSVCVSANQFTTSEFGFDTWFDSCYTITKGRHFTEGIDAKNSSGIKNHIHRTVKSSNQLKGLVNGVLLKLDTLSDGANVTGFLDDGCIPISKKALDVAEEQQESVFMFLNFMEGHLPHRLFRGMDKEQFDLSPSWNSNSFDHWEYNESERAELHKFDNDVRKFREFYAAAIEYLDRRVSTLIERLKKTLNDEVIAIITADHGENLGGEHDRYLMEHTGALTEGLLHVPFEVVNSPIEINGTDSRFSLCELPDLVTAIIDESDYTVGNQTVSAELLGEGLHLGSKKSEHWNRAIRCRYKSGGEKVEWDTLGNSYRVAVNVKGPSTEAIVKQEVKIDEKLQNEFGTELQSYKEQLTEENQGSKEVSEVTESRLSELGYL
jgi:hypothetical protein